MRESVRPARHGETSGRFHTLAAEHFESRIVRRGASVRDARGVPGVLPEVRESVPHRHVLQPHLRAGDGLFRGGHGDQPELLNPALLQRFDDDVDAAAGRRPQLTLCTPTENWSRSATTRLAPMLADRLMRYA